MPSPARLACATVPLFPLAARLRCEPELNRDAVAILEGNGSQARVVAANRRARQQGVRPGTTLAQARGLCSQLIARERDTECERAAQEALLETAETFSPRLEDAGEGLVFLDLDGLPGLDPPSGSSGEMELGEKLIRDLAAVSLPARVGIASSKLAARLAADLPQSPARVPPGEEADFLAPLPLERLAPEMTVAATLARWGIHSIGDLARLPGSRLASRFGARGQALHAAARGFDSEPLRPREPPPDFQEGLSLEWPIVQLEPFLFVGRAALERLGQRLEARGLACSRLLLTLRCEPEGVQERAIRLPAPTRDVKTLLALIRLELEARPPGAPVAAFRFTALPDRPREAQLSLYGPAALSPDKLATAMARLFSILGTGRAGSPRPVDGHCPERFDLVDFSPPPPPSERPAPAKPVPSGRGLLAVRVLRPPLPLEVILDGLQAPTEVRSQVQEETAKRLRIDGRVQVAAGPWALEEEWWQEKPVERDYWDVELAGAGGGLYRIYRDRATDEWYADGIYD